MLSCDDARRSMVPFVLDEAEDAEAAKINDHLAGCAACREQERLLLSLIETVRGETPAAGEALRSRIRSAVASQEWAARPSRGFLSRAAAGLRRPVPAYLLAAACLAGVVVAHRPQPATEDARSEARIGRIVASGMSAGFVVASPCETALDHRGEDAEGMPAPGGPPGRRPPGTDSL